MKSRKQFTMEECVDNFDVDLDLERPSAFRALQYISEKSQKSGLSPDFMNNENVQTCFAEVRKVLPFNDDQIILFSIITAFSLGRGEVEMDAIGSKLDISPYRLFDMENELKCLVDKGYVLKKTERFNKRISYYVDKDLIKSIHDGEPAIPKNYEEANDGIELIHNLSKFTDEMGLALEDYKSIIMNICLNNTCIDIVKDMDKHHMNALERVLIFCALDYIMTYESDITLRSLIMLFDDKNDAMFEIKQYLYDEENKLAKLKYIELQPSQFAQEDKIHLTDKALKAMLPKELKKIKPHASFDGKIDNCTLIKSKDIFEKPLIYDEKTSGQIQMMSSMLSNKGLSKLQKNLEGEGLRKGVNVLLYGYPGMGKTETVLQICKKTNRNVLQVNISEMKSMWFGQSEKIVEQVFTQYNELMKSTQNTPVLLFNEADAILSKRRNLGNNSGIGQTENTLQNILLQAFENNEGIIICTTNMIDNLDKAFARRFLYKIEFSKPDKETRTKLVRLKLGKYLTENECSTIAAEFNLTGGMLDNVITKIVAKKCLYGETATVDDIREFCRQDMIGEREQIKGFTANN
jgi:SpoVK/Ycf46/Vps4 family AAA+-type ATPase